MITSRPAAERGTTRTRWLDSRHTFSFAEYYDTAHMGFRALRVINDDRVAAGAGFPTHGHADMEIVTYVLEGALEHRDSLGTGSVIRPGDVQRMSAGTGVRHSEMNASQTEPVHFLQIWLLPARRGLAPSYEQKPFTAADKRGRLRLVASNDGRDGSVTVHQDVNLHAGVFGAGESASFTLGAGRFAWVQVARGALTLNGQRLGPGDGVAVRDEQSLTLAGAPVNGGDREAEVLVFDLG
jgi:redox-sensitive bicupin YhaK (pirin superfamily)